MVERRRILAALAGLGAAALLGPWAATARAASLAGGDGPGTPPAPALPEPLRGLGNGWRPWGSGDMRWFGLRLYNAVLWVAGDSLSDDTAYALQLTYQRDIAKSRLVGATLDELKRLGEQDEARLARWQAALEQVFPDVRQGDQITGAHLPGSGARFYLNGRLTGAVADERFARAFFAIWLSPQTREPALRQALLKRAGG